MDIYIISLIILLLSVAQTHSGIVAIVAIEAIVKPVIIYVNDKSIK